MIKQTLSRRIYLPGVEVGLQKNTTFHSFANYLRRLDATFDHLPQQLSEHETLGRLITNSLNGVP